MNNTSCQVCELPQTLRKEVTAAPSRANALELVVNAGHPHVSMAAIRRHRTNKCNGIPTPSIDAPSGTRRLELNAHGGEIETGSMSGPVIWTEVFETFGLNPTEYEIVDDTVRMSIWDAQTPEGVQQMRSYRAKFRARTTPSDELEASVSDATDWVRTWTPRPLVKARKGPGVTYVHLQGDEQSGKSEGDGLRGLAERESQILQASVDRVRELLARGVNIEAIADCSAGDRVENVFGHYASQPSTTDTLRNQLKFARDMDLARTRAFLELGLPLVKVYTPSNHGEMRTVVGKSPMTSASDNLDLIIAETVRDVLDAAGLADQIDWHIPHDEYLTMLELSGVGVGLTHGHKVVGRADTWAIKQRDNALFHKNFRMALLLMGHKHHAYIEEVNGTTIIQTPSLDGGSPYFEAMTGQRAAHGALSFLVGTDYRMGWDDLAVL